MLTPAVAGAAQAAACGADHGSAPPLARSRRLAPPYQAAPLQQAGRLPLLPPGEPAQASASSAYESASASARSFRPLQAEASARAREARAHSVCAEQALQRGIAGRSSKLARDILPPLLARAGAAKALAGGSGETGRPLVLPWPRLWPDLLPQNIGKEPRHKQQDGRPCSKLLPKQGRFVSNYQRQLSSCALLLLGLRPSGGTLPRLLVPAPQWLATAGASGLLELDDIISRQLQPCRLRA